MDFNTAVKFIIEREGGLVDHPDDPGGITKYGISLRSYPKLGRSGIINLTKAQAAAIYKRDFWDKARIGEFPAGLRLALFDAVVNLGVTAAVKILQKTLKVTVDGKLGPQTIGAAQQQNIDTLVAGLLTERIFYYLKIDQFDVFGRGWVDRLFRVAMK
jgi:lysozyme family protein